MTQCIAWTFAPRYPISFLVWLSCLLILRQHGAISESEMPIHSNFTIVLPEHGAILDPFSTALFHIRLQDGLVGRRIRCVLACRVIPKDRGSIRQDFERSWEVVIERNARSCQ
jgi:hypothetical protein